MKEQTQQQKQNYKYKSGDIVKIVNTDFIDTKCPFTLGYVGQLFDYHSTSNKWVVSDINKSGRFNIDNSWWLSETHFELVEQQDQYQTRYLTHQKKKAEILKQILISRHSTRVFNENGLNQLEEDKIQELINLAIEQTASSCDRKPHKIYTITERDQKALLGGILVGGVGWAHRAPQILLICVDGEAYKAAGEINYMPYLDGGFLSCNILNLLEANNFKACFINPNIREQNKEHFNKVFLNNNDNLIYIGAIAVGKSVS
jgi:hypothetical protein